MAMTKEKQDVEDHANLVYPCNSHVELHQWKI